LDFARRIDVGLSFALFFRLRAGRWRNLPPQAAGRDCFLTIPQFLQDLDLVRKLIAARRACNFALLLRPPEILHLQAL
jgi:hypothetical protein